MASTAHKTAAEYVEHRDDEATLERKISQLAEWIKESRHCIAFTGAGISTACGIPDFRSGLNTCLPTGAGAWTLRAAEASAGRRIEQSGVKRVSSLQAIPSKSHMALVELQRTGLCKFLVTQNTDGLHRRSGFPTSALAELHGNTNLERCSKCSAEYLRDFSTRNARGVHEHATGRLCTRCGGMLHDSIINFSESLPAKEIRAGFRAAHEADLCLALGSSLRVTPAAEIPEIVANKPQGRLVIVNLQQTPLDDVAAMRINCLIDECMERLMAKLKMDIPPFVLRRRVQVTQWAVPDDKQADAYRYTVQVAGVEADGTPQSLFREVLLDGRARTEQEPHRFTFRVSGGAGSGELKLPASAKLTLVPFGHYREPPVEIEVPLQPASVQTWMLEYDPRTTGRWLRQEMAAVQQGAEAATILAGVSGLPRASFLDRSSNNTPAKRNEEEKENSNAPARSVSASMMARLEDSEGRTAADAAIHAAVEHPPPGVVRVSLTPGAGRRAYLTKRLARGGGQGSWSQAPPRAVLITCAGAGGGPGELGAAGPSSVYEQLAERLPKEHDIAVLQVVYSKAASVPVATADVRAAIDYCVDKKWGPIILMGWSMGAAVVAEAGAPYAHQEIDAGLPTGGSHRVPLLRGVITLAGQSAGIDKFATFDGDHTAFLILHGDADDCLPARCAQAIHARVPQNATKQVVILPQNHHGVQDAEPILRKYIPKLIA